MYKAIAPGCIGHNVSLAEAAPVLAANGVEGVTIDLGAHSDPEAIRSILTESRLRAACFGAAVPWSLDGKDDFALLEAQAKCAAKLGLRRATTGIMPFSDTLEFAENYALHLARYRRSVEILREYGVRLGVEFIGVPSLRKAHKYEFIWSMDQMLSFLGEVDEANTGLLLDLFHFELAGHHASELTKLPQERIVLVHIMDAPDVPFAEQQDLVRALPGTTGVLKIGAFFSALETIGYDGPVLPEPFDPTLGKMSFPEAVAKTMKAVDAVWDLRA